MAHAVGKKHYQSLQELEQAQRRSREAVPRFGRHALASLMAVGVGLAASVSEPRRLPAKNPKPPHYK
jgi:hypothetical protein